MNEREKKMKKIKSIILSILIGLVVFSSFPIGGTSYAACAHLFTGGYTIIKEPTCTSTGIKVAKCVKCGVVLATVTIDALGHTYGGWVTQKSASCTISGFRMRTCSRCKTSQTQKINATGHTFNGGYTVTKAPTCTATGTKIGKCEKCHAVISTLSIDKLDHTYGGWTTQKLASCTISGFKMRTCSKCKTSETQKINATGHTFNGGYTITKEPTCVDPGTKIGKCEKCSAVVSTLSIDPLGKSGHLFTGEFAITKAPTCVSTGTKVGKCNICHGELTTVEIPALGTTGEFGHNYKYERTVAPTSKRTGLEVGQCTLCGKTAPPRIIEKVPESNYTYDLVAADENSQYGYVRFNGVKYPISISELNKGNDGTEIAFINKDQSSFNFEKFISGFSLTSKYKYFENGGVPKLGGVVLFTDLLGQIANSYEKSYYSISIRESEYGSNRNAQILVGSLSYVRNVEEFCVGHRVSMYARDKSNGGNGLTANIVSEAMYKAITGKDPGFELCDIQIKLDPSRKGTKYSENLYVNSNGDIVRHFIPFTKDKVFITRLDVQTMGLTYDTILDISYMYNPEDSRFVRPLLY